jgi:hypothetical protein
LPKEHEVTEEKKLDIKTVAAIGSLIIALTSFVWGKIDGCSDRKYNRSMAKENYEAMKDKIDEMYARLDVLEKLLPTLFKADKAKIIDDRIGQFRKMIDEKRLQSDEKMVQSGIDYAVASPPDSALPKIEFKKSGLPEFKDVEQRVKGE